MRVTRNNQTGTCGQNEGKTDEARARAVLGIAIGEQIALDYGSLTMASEIAQLQCQINAREQDFQGSRSITSLEIARKRACALLDTFITNRSAISLSIALQKRSFPVTEKSMSGVCLIRLKSCFCDPWSSLCHWRRAHRSPLCRCREIRRTSGWDGSDGSDGSDGAMER